METLSLNDLPGTSSTMSAEVCIVGAGAAGLYLSSRLSGVDTILLDAGPAVCVAGAGIGFDAQCRGDPYGGLTDGRSFGLGGSTSRWGGALATFGDQDLRADTDPHAAAWTTILAAVESRSGAVASALGMPFNPAAPANPRVLNSELARRFGDIGLELKVASWLPFGRRNLAFLAAAAPGPNRRGKILLDAVACRWQLDAGAGGQGRCLRLEARNRAGSTLTIQAQAFVIAAGAIESTRILQEIHSSHADAVLPKRAALGRGLSDHLSWRVARVVPADIRRSIRLFGPRITRGCLRSFRFVETRPSAEHPRFFAHVLYENDSPGFRLAREFLRAAQMRQPPGIPLADSLRGLAGLMRLAWERGARARLHIPDTSPAFLQLDMEQEASPSNRISLDSEADIYGRRKAVVDWRVSAGDYAQLHHASRNLLRRWSLMNGTLPQLEPAGDGTAGRKPHDAYHPVGTCRAGTDPEAVVDTDLRVRGTHNLFLLSTAVFPTAGTANPTFALLCLADRLADRIPRLVRSGMGS